MTLADRKTGAIVSVKYRLQGHSVREMPQIALIVNQ